MTMQARHVQDVYQNRILTRGLYGSYFSALVRLTYEARVLRTAREETFENWTLDRPYDWRYHTGIPAWDDRAMRDELLSRHYYVPKTSSSEELRYHLGRMQRNMLRYENHTIRELREWIINRGIELPARPKSKAVLAETLYNADKDLSFDRFLDLSPELRVRVYEEHCSSFGAQLYSPKLPPLALVSRQVRREVVPVFYAVNVFVVDIERVRTAARRERWRWRLDDHSTQFLKRSLDSLRVNTLQSVWVRVQHHAEGEPQISFNLLLDKRQRRADGLHWSVEDVMIDGGYQPRSGERRLPNSEELVKDVIEGRMTAKTNPEQGFRWEAVRTLCSSMKWIYGAVTP